MRYLPFLEIPVIGAPMGGIGTPELAAAVSNAGGLGILPCAYSTPEKIAEDIAKVRQLTKRPFGVNLFVEKPLEAIDDAVLRKAHDRLRVYREHLGIAHPDDPARPPNHYERQIDAVLNARPDVFSFTFGVPDMQTVQRFRDAEIFTIGTATSVEEAIALDNAGVDAVCAQGAEAGAHRGTFLGDARDSLIGTVALVPMILDAIRQPVIASGGIVDGRGVAAALALGASAVQLGTAFLLADEAATSPAYRQSLRTHSARETVVTDVFSGRFARGIRNRFIEEMSGEMNRAPYPYQNALTRDVRNAGASKGISDVLSLWAGQAFPLTRCGPAAEIIREVMQQARNAAFDAARALE
jgi:nitronate monooxygenase